MTQWSAQIAGLYTGQERMEGCRSELHSIRDELRRIDNKIRRQCPSLANSSVRARADSLEICAGNCADLGTTLGRIADRCRDVENSLSGYRDSGAQDTGEIGGASHSHSEADEVKFELSANDGLVQSKSAESQEVQFDYDWKDFIKSFGNVGSIYGIIDKTLRASTWKEWVDVNLGIANTVSKIAKDVTNYAKIGNAIGTKNATAYFWRKQFGFNAVGYASKASSPTARFYNNLHNTTSPYNLSDAFKPLTGKSGVFKTVAAWAGVALTGISNAFSNIEEQKESNGTMSTGRVVAETISETAIDTVVTYAGTAVVGAAITAATGVVAAPVVVAVATGVAIAGINAGVKAITGKSATEWVSDAILDTATAVGSAVADGAKAVANWFGRLSFA